MTQRAVEFRVGLGSCGVASGAEAVRDALEREGAVVKAVGCNGMCHREPIVEVVEPGGRSILYGNVDAPAARLIARRHIRSWRPFQADPPAPCRARRRMVRRPARPFLSDTVAHRAEMSKVHAQRQAERSGCGRTS